MNVKPMMRAGTALATLAAIAAIVPTSASFAQQVSDQSVDQSSVEEIVVTGSYIRRKSQFDSPSPIQVVGSEQLDQLGVSTIAELTQTLTINNGSQNNADAFTQNQTAGTENINLRGLGVQSTLVLLNGRRQVGSASPTDGGLNFVDTASLVPLIAVDRVEILKDGAAALYGTDAVAGVVNFITRDDFEGFELETEFQTVTEESSHDLRVSGIWGFGDDNVHVTLAGSYFDRTELSSRERDLRRGAQNPPGFQSISTATSFPPNYILPTSFGLQAVAPFDPAAAQLLAGYTAAFDQFTPFADIATQTLNVDPMTGQFLGFLPGNDGISDGLTAAVLSSFGVPGSILAQIGQASFLAQQQGIQDGVLTSFDTPYVPDPGCQTVADNFDSDTSLISGQVGNDTRIGPLGQCALDFGPYFSVIPEEERAQAYAKVNAQLTDTIEGHVEFSWARNRAQRGASNFPTSAPVSFPDLDFAPANTITGFEYPFLQPFNPFGLGTLFLSRSPGRGQINGDYFTDQPNVTSVGHNTYRISAGVSGELTETWFFDVGFLRASDDFSLLSHDGVASRTQAALRGYGGESCDPATSLPGTNGCLFYNPGASGFISDPSAVTPLLQLDNPFDPFNSTVSPVIGLDGNPVLVPVLNSQEVLQFISSPITFDNQSTLHVADAVITGDLFEMPAGTVGAAIGFQYRDEKLEQDVDSDSNAGDRLFLTQPIFDFSADRNVWATFLELSVPLTETLELSTAVRYENYSGGAGDTLDPKVSLLFRPFDNLTLRGSFGTGFRAPSLFQTFGNQTSLNAVIDPFAAGGETFVAITTLNNENLQPEESTTFNVGASFEPIENLELSADFWHFDFDDVITRVPANQLSLLSAAGAPLPAGTEVQRTATGGLLSVTTIFTNGSSLKTNGLDFSAAYTIDGDNLGVLRLGIDGTWVNKYDITGIDGVTIDGVGRSNRLTFAEPTPELRTNFSAIYANGGHSASVFVRRIGKLQDDFNTEFVATDPLAPGLPGLPDLTQVENRVGIRSHTTVDVQYSYNFDEGWGPIEGATFTVGAINLFDRDPPFVATDAGFESRTHDPRGRLVYVKAKFGF